MSSIELFYNNKKIDVAIEFCKRKHLGIMVKPNMQVLVRAPLRSGDNFILDSLNKRADWISKQLEYFAQFQKALRSHDFVTGATHYFLGRPYKLRITQARSAAVQLANDNSIVIKLASDHCVHAAKDLLLDWYSDVAHKILNARMTRHLPKFLDLGASTPSVVLKKMQRRWGSCSSKKVIVLNTELVKMSTDCIDYVVIHELCHLFHLSHNKKFYDLMEKIMPDYRQRKQKLEELAIVAL